jgi:isocitrate dehydrogenase
VNAAVTSKEFQLIMISNRGTKVWPGGRKETFTTDHWRCRFKRPDRETAIEKSEILNVLTQLNAAGIDFIKTEHLYRIDGEYGFTRAQGE